MTPQEQIRVEEFLKNTDPTLGKYKAGWYPIKTAAWCALSRLAEEVKALREEIEELKNKIAKDFDTRMELWELLKVKESQNKKLRLSEEKIKYLINDNVIMGTVRSANECYVDVTKLAQAICSLQRGEG